MKPDKVKQIIIDILKYLQRESRIRIYAYVIMPDHLHLILSSNNLIKNVANFKSYSARQIIKYYIDDGQTKIINKLVLAKPAYLTDRKHKFWQTGYSPKQISNTDMMQQKIDYIHYNPVRNKYVKEPEEWLFSSARNFSRLTSPLRIDEIVI
ncbi:MAG: transposase [Candidatus Marinimicrobia bacterium]|nr:transposase [Candidatus Neomarinimicrobiota bacterium]